MSDFYCISRGFRDAEYADTKFERSLNCLQENLECRGRGLDCSSDNYYLLVRNILNGTQTSNHYKYYEDLKLLYYLVSRAKEAFQVHLLSIETLKSTTANLNDDITQIK